MEKTINNKGVIDIMSEKIVVTEEQHPEKEWFAEAHKMTMENLLAFIDKMMNGYIHDYGTACHAVSACAIAAAWAAADKEGITGFQAGFVMWDFIRNWTKTHNECGLKLIDYDEIYEYKFNRPIRSNNWEHIQAKAKENLERTPDAHPFVIRHWRRIVDGSVPFGYSVSDE